MTPSVALVVHGGREAALGLAAQASARLGERSIDVETTVLASSTDEEHEDALRHLDASLIVSLGGDGTFLRAARRAHELDVPVIGVNFGRVGYLLDVEPEELDVVIADVLDGNAHEEHRSGMRLSVDAGGDEISFFSINELSLEKTVPGHVVRIATEIDGELFLTFSADGVVVSTPTGSTAYNLSAGGPVLSPSLDGIVITPVAPHFVLDRSVVLNADQVVTLHVVGDRAAICVVDGISVAELGPGHQVTCRRDPRPLRVVSLGKRGLGGRLRESLRQGHE